MVSIRAFQELFRQFTVDLGSLTWLLQLSEVDCLWRKYRGELIGSMVEHDSCIYPENWPRYISTVKLERPASFLQEASNESAFLYFSFEFTKQLYRQLAKSWKFQKWGFCLPLSCSSSRRKTIEHKYAEISKMTACAVRWTLEPSHILAGYEPGTSITGI